MKRRAPPFLVALGAAVSLAYAQEGAIVTALDPVTLDGAATLDLVEYDAGGVKLDVIAGVRSDEVEDRPVLEVSQGRLALIELRGRKVWVRLDRLQLSNETLPECPKSRVVSTDDRVVPGASGMGPECRREGGS